MQRTRRPSPALFVAVIALVAALAGTATALPGKNKVDKNDIKKGAVKSKAIKKNAVKAKHVANGAVGTTEIADRSVAEADIAGSEPRHIVGAAGEPDFYNGGEGDCVWNDVEDQISNYEPVSFYKDATGHVHLTGLVIAADGSGGDGVCDSSDVGEQEDARVFTLPTGYRPGNTLIGGLGSNGLVIVAPEQGTVVSGGVPQAIPPGVVASASGGANPTAGLDGTIYRTDPAPTSAAGGPEEISGSVLRRLTR